MSKTRFPSTFGSNATVVYRPIEELATEREIFLKLPYLACEKPWDQTMLAGYQGVEPIILSLFYGGGFVRSEDDRVLALVPEAATFDSKVSATFDCELWKPTARPIETRLCGTLAGKRHSEIRYSGAI